ncbi:MAG: DUF929 family protein [Candidatus Micrarchaeaceae archaeon]
MNRKAIYSIIGIVVAIAVIALAASQAVGGGNAAMDNVAVQQTVLARLGTIANNYTLASDIGKGVVNLNWMPSKTDRTTVLMTNGKPVVLYIGADYCPNCAAVRWGLILALDRFGNFTSLHYMTSSASDSAPNTPTFTFFNSSYYSPYITFESVELYTNKYPYQVLQAPNSMENSTFNFFDPQGGTPFVDFGNITVQLGAEFSPMLINNSTWDAIIGSLDDPSSIAAQAIIGNANVFTAQICRIINNSAGVCSQQFVKRLE